MADTRPGENPNTPSDPGASKSAFAKHHEKLQSESDRRMLEKNVPESVRSLITDPRYLKGDPGLVAEVNRRLTDEEAKKNPYTSPALDVEQQTEGQAYEIGLKHTRLDAEDRREVITLAQASNLTPEDTAEAVRVFEASHPVKKAFSYEEGEAALRKIYGTEFESKVEQAQEFVHQRPALAAWLDQTGGGNHPSVVQAIIALATRAAGIRAQIDVILRDREHAYWDASKPGHNEAVRKVSQLHRKLFAGKVA